MCGAHCNAPHELPCVAARSWVCYVSKLQARIHDYGEVCNMYVSPHRPYSNSVAEPCVELWDFSGLGGCVGTAGRSPRIPGARITTCLNLHRDGLMKAVSMASRSHTYTNVLCSMTQVSLTLCSSITSSAASSSVTLYIL